MKLSELRPCDCCGGKLIPMFHIIEVRTALFDSRAGRQTGGLLEYFGGLNNPGALAIAECMSPDADVVKVPSELKVELILCNKCYLDPPRGSDLCILVENRQRKTQEEEEKKHGVELGRNRESAGPGSSSGDGAMQSEEGGVAGEAKAG